MAAFKDISTDASMKVWVGDPTCQDGHGDLLAKLSAKGVAFDASIPASLTAPRFGNMGEYLTFAVRRDLFPAASVWCWPANAFDPLKHNSKTEIDLLWIHFGATDAEDLAYVQEVKTTGNPDMLYGHKVADDIKKLFGLDPMFTFQSRLDIVKEAAENQGNPAVVPRIGKLAAGSVATATKVRIVPTVCHERSGSAAVPVLSAIRLTIEALGWPRHQIEMWSISLTDLVDRFRRLVAGSP